MTDFDKDRVNHILEENNFGNIVSVVHGGSNGAFSTVFTLSHRRGETPKVLKLYKRTTGNEQLVKTEYNAMQKAYSASHTFPQPYAFIIFDHCANPHFKNINETLYGIVCEMFEPVVFKNTPTEIEILTFARDILEELVALHNISGFKHCDIKLSNVLMCPRNKKYSLIDFNTADTRCSTDGTITSYVLQGSSYYIDPQSLTTEHPGKYSYSPRSDIYALGMTLRLLLNRNMFEYSLTDSPDLDQLIQAKKNLGPFISLNYSKALCDLISKATAFEREDRFDSAHSMLLAVNTLLNDLITPLERTRAYHIEETFVPEYKDTVHPLEHTPSHKFSDIVINMSESKRTHVLNAIRSGNFHTALKLLNKTKDRYTEFFKGCAYLGLKDANNAEIAFATGRDMMSYYMLYALYADKYPAKSEEYLKISAEMGSPPAMFTYGYKLYKSDDPSTRSKGLNLIIRSAESNFKDAYCYLCKLQRRNEISTNLINNIDTENLTNTLSSFAN